MILKLITKDNLVDNVWSFRFEPSGAITWTAGQFIKVALPHENPDEEGTERWFTVSSAPFEGVVEITTRVTESTFKQALSKLQIDGQLELIDPPDGDFVWSEADRPVVFVAGGIGITPYHSMLKQRANDGLPLAATLIYGSRTADVPFKAELEAWSAGDHRLVVRYVVGEPLTAAKLVELEPRLNDSLVYVSGPEQMVEAIGEELKKQGLSEAQLRQDYFPNYTQSNY